MLFTDQLNRAVNIPFPPRRIISVVPSQTELLYTLGLSEEVVGITRFCIHPAEWFRTKTRIGGTKQLHLDKIRALQPDLIIANKEENEKSQIEALMAEYPVWISDIKTLDDALQMIENVGIITDKALQGRSLSQQIREQFDTLTPTLHPQTNGSTPTTPQRCAYFIWRNPWMVAGGDTFIHHMLTACGLENIFSDQSRYPTINLQELPSCELILLSSEPYPFKEQHIREIQAYCPNARILLVDGEMFSWYGSRLLHAPEYFKRML